MKAYRQTLVGLLIGGGVFFISFKFLKINILLSAIFAVGGYFGGYLTSKPTLKLAGVNIDSLPNAGEIKEIIYEAEKDLAVIERTSREAGHPSIRDKSKKLYDSGISILKYISENPKKIPQARRFLSYYLDTASEILKKYQKLAATNYKIAEMESLKLSTEKAMDILNEAFDKQFKKLIQNEMFDIEADIKVLEDTLKLEG